MLLELAAIKGHYSQISVGVELQVVDLKLRCWRTANLHDGLDLADLFGFSFGIIR